ncbi:MAG: cell division protein FtsL [Gammaproteobacteria bacterium]|nr:cell division protein FtsL [Gammaproteobacteria bacterium]MDT8370361.1 cell division protein FtsL [Gammaproteobacteria bacterium]
MSFGYVIEQLRAHFPIVIMIALLLVSAISVIYTKHKTRIEFVILQKLEQHRDNLNEEWGRLLLEQSTWATPGRIQQQAQQRLNMIVPSADMIVVVQP